MTARGFACAVATCAWACGAPPQPRVETAEPDVMFADEQAAEQPQQGPSATAGVLRAEELLATGDVERAVTLLRQALDQDSQDARALLNLGLAHEMSGDVPAAERAYRSAAAVRPGFPEALNNLGLLLRDQGRHDEAVVQLRAAVEARSDFASAHVNLALTLMDAGDARAAIDAFRVAVRFAPRDAMTRVNYGLLLLEHGTREQAEIELRRALPLAAGNPAALQAVGNGLRRAGQAELAVGAMTQAVQSSASPTPALLSELALAHRAAADRPAAEAALQRALALDADYATAHYLLGNMLAGRGAFTEAIAHYERYLALDGDGPHAERARERIRVARERSR